MKAGGSRLHGCQNGLRERIHRGACSVLLIAAAGVGLSINGELRAEGSPPLNLSRKALEQALQEGRISTIVAFGDSVVSGFRSPVAWPALLGQRLKEKYPGVRMINAGKPGDTSTDGLGRLEADVVSRKPDLVLISFGLNDMERGVPMVVFRQNIETMVDRLRGRGTAVVLLTTTRMVLGASVQHHLQPEDYNEQTRKTAESRGVPLVDVYQAMKDLNRQRLYLDLVHPNREGHTLLADLVCRGLIP